LFLGTAAAWHVAPSSAQGQGDGSSSLMAGTVEMKNPVEKQLFQRLLCMCGGCQRLPLSSCICSWAEKMRAKIRDDLELGVSVAKIQDDYRLENGARSIAIPSDRGLDRALWAVPLSLIALMAGFLVWSGKKWMRTGPAVAMASGVAPGAADGYDAALDDELRKLDE
jgi:cytochrome c-type biogenesis protein CcmH/NrfF